MAINKILIRPNDPAAVQGDWTQIQVVSADGGLKFVSLKDSTRALRQIPQVAKLPIAGSSSSSGVIAYWANPEAGSILITKVVLDRTTKSTGASSLDIGTTATGITTSSDNLIDGVVSSATEAAEDNVTSVGTNGKGTQKLATGKWVTVAEASGDVDGLVANLYISYIAI